MAVMKISISPCPGLKLQNETIFGSETNLKDRLLSNYIPRQSQVAKLFIYCLASLFDFIFSSIFFCFSFHDENSAVVYEKLIMSS